MNKPVIYRANLLGLLALIIGCAGFTYFGIDLLVDNWGSPLWAAVEPSRHGPIWVWDSDLLGWVTVLFFGLGGLFAISKSLVHIIGGHRQVLNITADGIAVPLTTSDFRRIPWRNIQRITAHNEFLEITLVTARQSFVPALKHRNRSITVSGNVMTIDLYRYVPLFGGNTEQLASDLKRLSEQYLAA